MRRILTTLTALAICITTAMTALVLATPLAGQAAAPTPPTGAAAALRATTSGQVGAHSFPNIASCVYSRGRLTAITFRPVSAAGRRQWEPTGQWVLWGARLQVRTGSGAWRKVGGTQYSDARVEHAGAMRQLKAVSIPRIFGTAGTRYRVVHTIYWYFNNRSRPIVQGRASLVVGRYVSDGRRSASCAGTNTLRLPPLTNIRNDELDAVRLSFAARSAGARVTYGLRGALPRGLRLNTDTGVVRGTVSALATNVTGHYKRIRARSFGFTITARANGRTTSRSYSWVVSDTAFRMQNYYGRYGCGAGCQGNDEPVRNISSLGPKLPFGCSNEVQPGIPADRTGVIYRQAFQKEDGSLAPSAGRIFRYGDVFRWWYYPCA